MSAAIVLDWTGGGKRSIWDPRAQGKLPQEMLDKCYSSQATAHHVWSRRDVSRVDDAVRAARAGAHGQRECKFALWINRYDLAAAAPRAGLHRD